MIVITEIIYAGGACPYQLEAQTSEGHYLYLRYRDGRLRAGTAPTEAQFGHRAEDYNIINEKVGEDLDGWADHDKFMMLLKDKIKFPEEFVFKFESYDKSYL